LEVSVSEFGEGFSKGSGEGSREEKKGALSESWMQYVGDQFDQPYMQDLSAFLKAEKAAGKIIFPAGENIFNALNRTPFGNTKVVILGQDPYHGPGQAHGLSFSVPQGVRLPPSLLNIYKELVQDMSIEMPLHGCLEHWADQGVLLLNAVLTVEQGNAGAHQGKGWERFTDSVIQALNEHRDNLVFILWGSYAQKKGQFIDQSKHLVLKSVHPSPLSAHRGFFGSRPFSQANAYLRSKGMTEIDWRV
jgi:uracil-DNA glycosylase